MPQTVTYSIQFHKSSDPQTPIDDPVELDAAPILPVAGDRFSATGLGAHGPWGIDGIIRERDIRITRISPDQVHIRIILFVE